MASRLFIDAKHLYRGLLFKVKLRADFFSGWSDGKFFCNECDKNPGAYLYTPGLRGLNYGCID